MFCRPWITSWLFCPHDSHYTAQFAFGWKRRDERDQRAELLSAAVNYLLGAISSSPSTRTGAAAVINICWSDLQLHQKRVSQPRDMSNWWTKVKLMHANIIRKLCDSYLLRLFGDCLRRGNFLVLLRYRQNILRIRCPEQQTKQQRGRKKKSARPSEKFIQIYAPWHSPKVGAD